MASPSWYEPAAIDAEQLEWLERAREPVLDPELPIIDVSDRRLSLADYRLLVLPSRPYWIVLPFRFCECTWFDPAVRVSLSHIITCGMHVDHSRVHCDLWQAREAGK